MSAGEARDALGDVTGDPGWKDARQALYERSFMARDWWALEGFGSHCATPSSAALSDRALAAILTHEEGVPDVADWDADPRWQALRYRLARLAFLAHTEVPR